MLPEKNSTPGAGSSSIESVFEDARPTAVILDRSSAAATDPASQREGAVVRHGDLHARTGMDPLRQWHSKYFSQVLPFVLPRMVSGPDFDPHQRWRRTEDAPWVDPIDFANAFVRRIEAPCRVDWRAASMVRHVCFKHVAEHTMASCGTFSGMRFSAVKTSTDEYVKAARNLSHHLYYGFVGKGIHRMPIAGDTTKLPDA